MSTTRRDYFSDRPDRVAALRRACESWAGTPFRKHSRVKGPHGGVDCEWFVPSAFHECGAITADEMALIVVPGYELNHAEHSTVSLFHRWFQQSRAQQRVRAVDEAEPHLDGDLVFPVVGLCEHHIAIRIGQIVHHIARPSGYCEMTVAQLDRWVSQTPSLRAKRGLHRSRYRLLEVA
jgi:hypothetical protein